MHVLVYIKLFSIGKYLWHYCINDLFTATSIEAKNKSFIFQLSVNRPISKTPQCTCLYPIVQHSEQKYNLINMLFRCPSYISYFSVAATWHDVVSSHWNPPLIFHWLQALICVWPAVLEAQQKKTQIVHMYSGFPVTGDLNYWWVIHMKTLKHPYEMNE